MHWFKSIKRLTPYSPIRLQGIVMLIAMVLLYILRKKYILQQQPSAAFMVVLIEVLLVLCVCSFVFAIVNVALSWFIAYTHKRRENLIHLEQPSNTGSDIQTIPVSIHKLIIPLLGRITLRCTIHTDTYTLTEIFANSMRQWFWPSTIQSTCRFVAPAIDTYTITSCTCQFIDVFGFFAWPLTFPQTHEFIQLPTNKNIETYPLDAQIGNAPSTYTPIPQPIPGDWLQYKKFENQDDVRRIVWKIYAKNKELIVRQAEEKSTYASTSLILPMFDLPQSNFVHTQFWTIMNNTFKEQVYNIWHQIHQTMPAVEIVIGEHKHTNPNPEIIASATWNQFSTINFNWQKQQPSLLVLHSLHAPDDVRKWLHNISPTTQIILVKLSKPLQMPPFWLLLSWIFIKPQLPSDTHKIQWRWHPLRKKIIANEQQLCELISAQKFSFYML